MSLIPARIDGIALGVEDVSASAEFYRETLGFEQLVLEGELARFRLENVLLTLIDRRTLIEETHVDDLPRPPGPVTLAILVTRSEIDEYVQRLESAGVRVLAPPEDKRLGPRIGFVTDLDGHIWELLQRE